MSVKLFNLSIQDAHLPPCPRLILNENSRYIWDTGNMHFSDVKHLINELLNAAKELHAIGQRMAEAKDEAGNWVNIARKDIKRGQTFREFADGKLVEIGNPPVVSEFIAATDAYFDDGMWKIGIY